jgi:CheY-like chemotaxis protein
MIVDDDVEDQELIHEVCSHLKINNKLLFFHDGKQVLDFLRKEDVQPFLILCDVNMPVIDGLQLRKIINEDDQLRFKAIPFVFMSTSARQRDVDSAYRMTVQGFFEKGYDFERLRHRLYVIFEYWKECKHPNCFAINL